MSTPVELIVGPARSGKSGRVVAAYLDVLADAEPGRALMLVTTALRRRATEDRLLAARGTGVLVRPQVLTFPDLAERLLVAARRPVRRIGDLARRHVIRECLARLGAKEAAVLGPARETPGLVDALDELFRELKDARVEPDVFGHALVGPMRTPRNRVLSALYTSYQRALREGDLYDDAGRFWHAADLVAEGRFGPFAELDLLVADGFQDFVPAQMDVLEALSRRARRTLITLTWAADRVDLFATTARTRERLRERFGDRLTETEADDAPQLPAGLERIRTRLFAMGTADDGPAADGSASVIAAAGRTRQFEEVARRTSDLLRAEPDARPDGIAVLARSVGVCADLAREVFPRYGIRFRVQADRRLDTCPVVRAAMNLVRLQGENYTYRALVRVLASNYVSPESFGGDAATARSAVRLAREANVWEGRENYGRAIGYLRGLARRRAETTDDSGEPVLAPEAARARLEELDRAEAMLERLFEALALPASATRREFAKALRQMVRAAGLWDAAAADTDEARRARDLKGLAELERVLDEVAALDEKAVPRETFLADLADGVRHAAVGGEEPADAPVVVMDVLHGRALTFDHVFLVDLAEKTFPRTGRQHPFFDDGERESLRARGVDLADTGHDAQREMLLYYLAVTRAERTVTLAYSALDTSGRPALASHYLDETTELFAAAGDGRRLPTAPVSVRDLEPEPEAARSEPELLARTMVALWGPGETRREKSRLAVLEALRGRGEAAETALTGLAVEQERERGEAFGRFDGVLAAEDLVEDLCERFPGTQPMSAHRLETFGRCPFAFFAQAVLALEAEEEPSPDLGPLDVGLIYHGLLERFFGALLASKTLDARLSEEEREAALTLLEETAGRYFAGLEQHGRVGSPALWTIQKENILRDVRRLVDWHIGSRDQQGWRPARVEAPFGPGTPAPVAVEVAHGTVRLRGRIDRVDRPADGSAGFQVIDYKSGSSAPSAGAMAAGTSFQLPVYVWAAEALGGRPTDGSAVQAYFLPVRRPARSGLLRSEPTGRHPEGTLGPALERSRRYIERFTEAMRLGKFAVWPQKDGCRFCDYQSICRVALWRLRRKWDENPIAELAREGATEAADEEDEP